MKITYDAVARTTRVHVQPDGTPSQSMAWIGDRVLIEHDGDDAVVSIDILYTDAPYVEVRRNNGQQRTDGHA